MDDLAAQAGHPLAARKLADLYRQGGHGLNADAGMAERYNRRAKSWACKPARRCAKAQAERTCAASQLRVSDDRQAVADDGFTAPVLGLG